MSDCDVRLDSQFDLKYKCDLFLASFVVIHGSINIVEVVRSKKKYICTSLGTTVPHVLSITRSFLVLCWGLFWPMSIFSLRLIIQTTCMKMSWHLDLGWSLGLCRAIAVYNLRRHFSAAANLNRLKYKNRAARTRRSINNVIKGDILQV